MSLPKKILFGSIIVLAVLGAIAGPSLYLGLTGKSDVLEWEW